MRPPDCSSRAASLTANTLQWATIEVDPEASTRASQYTFAKVPGPGTVGPGDRVTLQTATDADIGLGDTGRSHRIVAVESANKMDLLITATGHRAPGR